MRPRTIRKYGIRTGVPLLMPYGAHILSVGAENGEAVLWALVHPDRPVSKRELLIFLTEETVQLPKEHRFIGTIHVKGPGYYLDAHCFESNSDDRDLVPDGEDCHEWSKRVNACLEAES